MNYFVIMFLLVLSATNSYSADLSSLDVGVYSYDSSGAFSMTTNVHFIIRDSAGRLTGQNPFTGEEKGEIPNSGYSIESLGELKEGGDSANEEDILPGPESVSFEMGPVQETGLYHVQVFGMRDTKYSLTIRLSDIDHKLASLEYAGYISSGATDSLSINIDPTPGTPAPVISKTITYDVLRKDVSVARQLNQLGDDKFARSLVKAIDLGEKLSGVCDKRRHGKDKSCQPAIAVLKLFVRRLEKANQKCDSKKPQACNEDKDWDDFDKDHRKDHDYDDFFKDWDRDDWHKDKKTCKRFVTDEALKIISEDANDLVKSLDGEIGKGRGKNDQDEDNGHGGKNDKKDDH